MDWRRGMMGVVSMAEWCGGLLATGERSSCGGRMPLLAACWMGDCEGDCLMARRSAGEATSVILPLLAWCVTCLEEDGGERCSMADSGICGLLPAAVDEAELLRPADSRLLLELDWGGLGGVTGAPLPF